MNRCNDCKYFDKINNEGGACHAMPPTLFKDSDGINEHRPYVPMSAIACSLYKPSNQMIEDLVA